MKIFDEKILKNKKKIDKKNFLSKIWAKNVWAKNFLVKFFFGPVRVNQRAGGKVFQKTCKSIFLCLNQFYFKIFCQGELNIG